MKLQSSNAFDHAELESAVLVAGRSRGVGGGIIRSHRIEWLSMSRRFFGVHDLATNGYQFCGAKFEVHRASCRIGGKGYCLWRESTVERRDVALARGQRREREAALRIGGGDAFRAGGCHGDDD